jgi:hypothetical protein
MMPTPQPQHERWANLFSSSPYVVEVLQTKCGRRLGFGVGAAVGVETGAGAGVAVGAGRGGGGRSKQNAPARWYKNKRTSVALGLEVFF